MQVDIVSGTDFPKELQDYDFIIHCGACMFNKNMFNSEWNRQKGRNTDDELRNCYRIYERDTGAYYILKSKIKVNAQLIYLIHYNERVTQLFHKYRLMEQPFVICSFLKTSYGACLPFYN